MLYHVRMISDKKVFVCSRALALSILGAKALLRSSNYNYLTGHDISAAFPRKCLKKIQILQHK